MYKNVPTRRMLISGSWRCPSRANRTISSASTWVFVSSWWTHFTWRPLLFQVIPGEQLQDRSPFITIESGRLARLTETRTDTSGQPRQCVRILFLKSHQINDTVMNQELSSQRQGNVKTIFGFPWQFRTCLRDKVYNSDDLDTFQEGRIWSSLYMLPKHRSHGYT